MIEWNGRKYRTVTAAARDNYYRPASLRMWISRGCTCDDDIAAHHRRYKPTDWNGQRYSTVEDAAAAAGVPYSTMKTWVRRGLKSLDDVRQFYPRSRHVTRCK